MEHCAYPPQPANDLELAEQQDGERIVWMAGAVAIGRYVVLGATERNVLMLIDGARTPSQICAAFQQQYSGKLSLATLTKFLTKLESYGLLDGKRGASHALPHTLTSQAHYRPIKLFNPDVLFTRLAPRLRWIWTTGFFVFSLALILGSALLALVNAEEVTATAAPLIRDHYLAIFVAAFLVGVTHEFAHGMTCKVFGGRATEVGVLIVYYVLPALYCNVSGIHLIPQRNRRLWVIAAGIYWQLMVGAVCYLLWSVLAQGTLLADAVFIVMLGSTLDVFFNANPLIRLDGYYFLSQWLRMTNLMDRSRAYWRGLLRWLLFGTPHEEAARYSRRECRIYLIYGLLSFVYNVAFASFVVVWVSDWLIERFNLLGLLLAVGVVLYFTRRTVNAVREAVATWCIQMARNVRHRVATAPRTASPAPSSIKGTDMSDNTATAPLPFWRRRMIPLALAALAVAVLLMPWSASVGNYGTLLAVPGQEAIIRAPESGTLVSLSIRPGDQVAAGAVIAQMGNVDVEEQIVAIAADLARAQADADRLTGELHASEATVTRAAAQLRQRQYDYDELETERRQINAQRQNANRDARIIAARFESTATSALGDYPAALAALAAEADYARAQATEAAAQRDRARKLTAEGIVPRNELDAAEMRAATSASALSAARQRLEAALTAHRRQHTGATTEVNLASSDLSAERLRATKLDSEIKAAHEVIAKLTARRDLLQRKRSQFELTATRGGHVFGEELPRMVGQHFERGGEICRIADTSKLLLRVQVPEREIGDIRVGHGVRLKTRAHPDRVFRGTVANISGESETDANGQTTYRVELAIENTEGLLRPGMTAFARIDFDRQMIGQILLHKIRQALRPELWML